MSKPAFPIGHLTLLWKYHSTIGPCDLCLILNKITLSYEFYKDEDRNGWNICYDCKEELERDGFI